MWPALGKRPICRVPALALGKNIGHQFCCEAFLQYHDQHVQIWHIFSTFCYIFSLYFDLLNFSGKCRFELRVHRIFDLNDSKSDILVFECKVRPNPWTDPKFRSTCARGNATIFRAGGFLILKIANEFRKSRNLSRCHDIVCVCCGQNLKKFPARCTYDVHKPTHVGMYWFVNIVRATCSKLFQIFTTAYAYDIMTSRQVSRFSEFVCNF